MLISDEAYYLYDGGWRSADKEEMLSVYDDLSEEEATRLCHELAIIEQNALNQQEEP